MKSPQWGLREIKRDRSTLSVLTKPFISQQSPEVSESSLLTETLFIALKVWPSCSIQGPLVFLCRNALEGNVSFPMLLAEASIIAKAHVMEPSEVKGFIV